MEKLITHQSMSGSLCITTKNDVYYIEFIQLEEYGQFIKGFNVRSKSGINHYANNLLHGSFDKAYKIVRGYIKNEKFNY